MVTIITAAGSPIMLPSARDACMLDGRLVCFDGDGQRLLSFDPLDVTAYAVETPGLDATWVMGGPALAMTPLDAPEPPRMPWRLPGRLRFTYR